MIVKRYEVHCDRCTASTMTVASSSPGRSGQSSNLARAKARSQYGYVRRDGKDLCPRCQ